jgi:hypothetical protein
MCLYIRISVGCVNILLVVNAAINSVNVRILFQIRLFNSTFSIKAMWCQMIGLWIGKYLEGSSYSLIEMLSQHLPGGTEENREGPQDSRCLAWDLNEAPLEYRSRVLPLDKSLQFLGCFFTSVTAFMTPWSALYSGYNMYSLKYLCYGVSHVHICSLYLCWNVYPDCPVCCNGIWDILIWIFQCFCICCIYVTFSGCFWIVLGMQKAIFTLMSLNNFVICVISLQKCVWKWVSSSIIIFCYVINRCTSVVV